jgi:hypothetical protein
MESQRNDGLQYRYTVPINDEANVEWTTEDGVGVSSERVKEGPALNHFMKRVKNSLTKQKNKAL